MAVDWGVATAVAVARAAEARAAVARAAATAAAATEVVATEVVARAPRCPDCYRTPWLCSHF